MLSSLWVSDFFLLGSKAMELVSNDFFFLLDCEQWLGWQAWWLMGEVRAKGYSLCNGICDLDCKLNVGSSYECHGL
jgi:hypothetical protein